MGELFECDHCGRTAGNYAGGWASISSAGGIARVCHPNAPHRPDCYRRVTVYGEPLGALRGRPEVTSAVPSQPGDLRFRALP